MAKRPTQVPDEAPFDPEETLPEGDVTVELVAETGIATKKPVPVLFRRADSPGEIETN